MPRSRGRTDRTGRGRPDACGRSRAGARRLHRTVPCDLCLVRSSKWDDDRSDAAQVRVVRPYLAPCAVGWTPDFVDVRFVDIAA